jgi:CBS domain-containing protein
MPNYAMPIALYMSSPVIAVAPATSLREAHHLLMERRISSLPVVDEAGKLLGVVSRTDLLRVGSREAGRRPEAALLSFPERTVAEVMTRDALTLSAEGSVSDAAALLVDNRVHRIFALAADGRLAGIFSTKDVMAALVDKRDARPLTELMSHPVITVRVEEPLSVAALRLERAHVHGVVVLEGEWPVGIFTQVEALASRELPRETPVEEVMSPALLCYDARSPLHRAAHQARALDVRLVVATEERKVMGVLSGTDFARAAR